ncbi:hypothetical protein D3C87_2185030 [compost metagenome]
MFVDDNYLTVIRDNIIFVSPKECLSTERLVHVVNRSNILRRIEVLDTQHFLNTLNAKISK